MAAAFFPPGGFPSSVTFAWESHARFFACKNVTMWNRVFSENVIEIFFVSALMKRERMRFNFLISYLFIFFAIGVFKL